MFSGQGMFLIGLPCQTTPEIQRFDSGGSLERAHVIVHVPMSHQALPSPRRAKLHLAAGRMILFRASLNSLVGKSLLKWLQPFTRAAALSEVI